MARYIDVGGIKKHIIRDGNLIGERNYITFSELDEIPSADVVNRNHLIETIKHYAQYPDGIHKLLAVYAERRTDGEIH